MATGRDQESTPKDVAKKNREEDKGGLEGEWEGSASKFHERQQLRFKSHVWCNLLKKKVPPLTPLSPKKRLVD